MFSGLNEFLQKRRKSFASCSENERLLSAMGKTAGLRMIPEWLGRRADHRLQPAGAGARRRVAAFAWNGQFLAGVDRIGGRVGHDPRWSCPEPENGSLITIVGVWLRRFKAGEAQIPEYS